MHGKKCRLPYGRNANGGILDDDDAGCHCDSSIYTPMIRFKIAPTGNPGPGRCVGTEDAWCQSETVEGVREAHSGGLKRRFGSWQLALNSNRGVISEPGLFITPEAEIFKGFSDQGTIQRPSTKETKTLNVTEISPKINERKFGFNVVGSP
ncbi:hypothetical protein TNCV_3158411 [Trichonephila clavipes]|nr:hypothetical protein TNCV_3158411 [Trichonephila clavipes]